MKELFLINSNIPTERQIVVKLFTLCSIATVVGAAGANIHSIKLYKTAQQVLFQLHKGTSDASIHGEQVVLHGARPKNVHQVRLDSHYYANISIGSSLEQRKVVVDTRAAAFWLTLPPNDEDVVSQQPITDTIHIGDITIHNEAVGNLSSYLPFREEFDGILGMGLSNAKRPREKTVMQNLIEQGLLDEPVFAIYLSRDEDSGAESLLTLGSIDRTKYKDDMQYFPVVGDSLWEVALDAIALGDQGIELEDTNVAFDTGSTNLIFPSILADLLNKNIGATRSEHGQHIIDCQGRSSLPVLSFKIGNQDFAISANDYIYELQDVCVSAIVGFDTPERDSPLVLLGQRFLQRWYSVYDLGNRRVGLAKAV